MTDVARVLRDVTDVARVLLDQGADEVAHLRSGGQLCATIATGAAMWCRAEWAT